MSIFDDAPTQALAEKGMLLVLFLITTLPFWGTLVLIAVIVRLLYA